MKKAIGKTLARQFTVIILLILLAGQGILYSWLLLYQKAHLEKSLADEMASIARYIADAAADLSDQRPVDQVMGLLLGTGKVLFVRLVDREGRTIAVKGTPPDPSELAETDALHPRRLFFIPAVNTIRVPFRAGSAELFYPGKPVNEVMERFLVIPPLLQSVTFLVVIYAIILFFRRKVSLPVAGINAALARITEGDLAAEVPDAGESEINSIATGARFLAEKLSSTLTRYNSLSTDVVAAIDQLTAAFAAVRETVRKQAEAIDGVMSVIRAANEQQRESVESTDRLSRAAHDNTSSLLEMKSAAEEIAASTERLFRSAEGSYAMISAMSQATRSIAESSEEVFRAAENTSASVEEISASLVSVRENARKSSELSSHVRHLLTDRGTLAVADAVDAMERIAEEVDHFARIVARLDERSKDIEKVLSVIKEVTEKTNLLSLNASILASQAGEQGKGFSVVAGEIRALSDSASSSAKDIASIVGMIQTQVREAVEAINTGVTKVEQGKELIFKSGEAMGETLETAQQSAQMTAVVEKSAEEQAQGLRQIRLAMENVRRMLEQMAKSTEDERTNSGRMLGDIGEVKAAAELVRKGTREHAAGTKVISENLEMSRDIVSRVHRAAQDQLSANDDIVGAVDRIKAAGLDSLRELETMARSFGVLRNEVDLLKQELAVFRTRSSSAASPPGRPAKQ